MTVCRSGGEWRPIPGYEGAYAINRDGDVLSLERVIEKRDGTRQPFKTRLLTPMRHDKLKTVVLSDHGVQRRYYVHKLVRETFGDVTARQ
jgi:hypothetical protein